MELTEVDVGIIQPNVGNYDIHPKIRVIFVKTDVLFEEKCMGN